MHLAIAKLAALMQPALYRPYTVAASLFARPATVRWIWWILWILWISSVMFIGRRVAERIAERIAEIVQCAASNFWQPLDTPDDCELNHSGAHQVPERLPHFCAESSLGKLKHKIWPL